MVPQRALPGVEPMSLSPERSLVAVWSLPGSAQQRYREGKALRAAFAS